MEEKTTVKKVFKKTPRKKVCTFCQEKIAEIDYKDVNRLKKFVTEGSYVRGYGGSSLFRRAA